MAKQARGRKGRLAFVEEADWGVTPNNPSMQQLKALRTGEGIGATIEELISQAITTKRAVQDARGGNIDVSGDAPFELAVTGLGPLLKHAIGSVQTGQDATQPSNITGVEVLYAEKNASAGDGTLDFAATGTTLTWTAPGDAAGPAVDVSAGGDFTLESSSAGESLTVRVDAASLPGQDESDAITVSQQFKHRLTRGPLPAGISLERGFLDISQFAVLYGCKIDSLSLTLANSGYVTGSLGYVGKGFTLDQTELATPTVPAHNPIVHHEATVEEGESPVDIRELTLELANNHETDSYIVGSRERGSLVEGEGGMTGSVTFLYRGNTQLDKWANETESSLEADFVTANGRLRVRLPRVKFFGDAMPKIHANTGILLSMSWRGLEDASADKTDVLFELVNDESAI